MARRCTSLDTQLSDDKSEGFISGDDEMETDGANSSQSRKTESHTDGQTTDENLETINKLDEIPKIIFDIDRPECASNGICRECELSRKVEADYQLGKSECSQQQIPHETSSTCDKGCEGDCNTI